MKKVLLALGMFCGMGYAHAQYYAISYINAGENPGNINQEATEYPVGGGLSAGWANVLMGPSASPAWSSAQTIPFAFNWNGGPVSSYRVSSSGVLTFSTANVPAPSYTNASLPSTEIPDSSAVIWGLTGSNSGDNIVSKTFGTAPNRQHWVFFTSFNFNGSTNNGQWSYWSIVLEETTNKIYMVDQRTANGVPALTIGLQLDGSTALQIPGSPNIGSYSVNAPDPSDNSYYEFNFGTQPALDLDNVSITSADLQPVSSNVNITGLVRNLGSSAVTSFEVAYTVNGGSAVTGTVTGVNIASGTSYEYTHPVPYNATEIANLSVTTEILSVNNGTDENNSNDDAEGKLIIHGEPFQRMPLIESFSSSTCGPCAPGNANVKSILEPFHGQYAMIKYQMSWPGTGDPYYTEEGNTRRGFYAVNSVPAIFTDAVPGTGGGNSNTYVASDITSAIANDAFIEINASGMVTGEFVFAVENGELVITQYGQEVDVEADIDLNVDFEAGQRAYMAIIENLTFNNEKSNGETEFGTVFKKMLPDANGLPLGAIDDQNTLDFNQNYTFNGDYRLPNNAGDPINHAIEHSIEEFNDLSAVIWVQDPVTRYVWNSVTIPLVIDSFSNSNLVKGGTDETTIWTVGGIEYIDFEGGLVPLGIDDVFGAKVGVFPNPANDVLNITGVSSNATMVVYDAMGRMVSQHALQNNAIYTANWTPGVYNLVITDGSQQTTKRISIVH